METTLDSKEKSDTLISLSLHNNNQITLLHKPLDNLFYSHIAKKPFNPTHLNPFNISDA